MADLVKLTSDLIKKSPQLNADASWYADLNGQIVFAYRNRIGLTQAELAKLSNVTNKTIHRIEGGSNTDTTSLNSVFDALSITANEIGEAFIELSQRAQR